MHTTNQVCIYLTNTHYTTTIENFCGKDQSHDSLSLTYKFVVALISANLYSQKTKGQRGHIK